MAIRRIAVLGTGKVASSHYLPYLAGLTGVEVMLWNRTPETAARLGASFGASAADSVADVIAWAPDVAFVLTSERARLPIATQLVEAGTPRLFLEKPLTAGAGQANVTEQDYEDARGLLARADSVGCQAAINFNYRFFACVMDAQREIRSGRWGELTSITARAHYACWSHVLDLLRHFAGDMRQVCAIRGRTPREGRGMVSSDVAFAFESTSGVVGTAGATASGPWSAPLLDISLELESARLRIWDLDGGFEIVSADGGYVNSRRLGPEVSRWDRYAQSFRASLAAYFEAVRADQPPPVPASDGLMQLRLEAAISRSVSRRSAIDMESEFPL